MACSEGSTKFPPIKTTMLPTNALKGKVAFITGGGTGLGKAMALTFASLGAQVAIAARRMDVLQKTANEIHSKTGQTVIPIQMNVKEAEEVSKAAEQCTKEIGLPNIIVNNAAGNFISPTERLSPNAFKTVIDIVLSGSAFVTLEFGKRLIAANQGASFLSITTPYARHGSPFVSPSASAKAGVEALTKSLAAEWGRYGLRFNCIAPGPIYTEGAFDRLDPSGERSKQMKNSMPVGRLGETEELANLAAYMCSDYASWMNGSIVDFDGGQQRALAGLFSHLHSVTPEEWDMLESMIRQKSKASKAKI